MGRTGVRTGFGDDGASAVEFALVLPLLAMLIFGGLTAGLALNNKQQLNHAAREGARFAATLADEADPCGAGSTWASCVRDRVVGSGVGSLDLTRDGLCISRVEEDGSVTTTPFGTSTTGATELCFTESPALSGARVQVVVNSPSRVDAVLFRGDVTLTAEAVARYEVED